MSQQEQKLDEVIIKETIRPNGTRRIQQDFSNCPTLAEQHTAHLTDINYLIKRYKPDELAMYLEVRSQHRKEILGHDFSQEPNLQEANNIIYKSKQEFNDLPDKIKSKFGNHLEFLKFVDNPANAEKLIELGILTRQKLDKIIIPDEARVQSGPVTDAPAPNP